MCADRRDRAGREAEAAADQLFPELVAGPDQPARNRADRQPENPGGLVMRLALKVTNHDGDAERVGQPAQLQVEGGTQFVEAFIGCRFLSRHGVHLPFASLPTGFPCLEFSSRPHGDTIEPVGQQLPPSNRAGLAGQDQEGGLKRVLGVVGIAQDPLGRRPGPSARAARPRRRRSPRHSSPRVVRNRSRS